MPSQPIEWLFGVLETVLGFKAVNMHNTHVENPDGLEDIEVWLFT